MSTATAAVPYAGSDDRPYRPVQEDDDRWYPYPPTREPLVSVTTAIGSTDYKPWIAPWHGRTTAAYCVDNLDLVAATRQVLGRQAAVDLGKDEATRLRDVKKRAGKHVHDVLEALILWAASRDGEGAAIDTPPLPDDLAGALYDLGDGEEPPLLADVVDWMVDGFINFVAAFNPEFAATEMTVYHQPHGWGGTLDMIIVLRGYKISYGTGPDGKDEIVACPGATLVICVDAKTGKAMEGTWQEQLAAYRRARECDPTRMGELRPMPPTDCGAVLHLRPEYPDGFLLVLVSSDADEAAYARFRDAARVYLGRQKVKARPGPSIRPLRADGTMPPQRLCDVAGMGYGHALAPLRKALGADAELTVVAEFTADELLAVKGIGDKLIEVIKRMLADHRLAIKDDPRSALAAVTATAGKAA